MKAAVIYWSGTGNTEQMAQAIADAAGAELFAVSDFSGSIADYDRIAFGCSAMAGATANGCGTGKNVPRMTVQRWLAAKV